MDKHFALLIIISSVVFVSGCTSDYLEGNIKESSESISALDREIIQGFNIAESEVINIYISPADERLIFTKGGIITNRFDPTLIYIPYVNIDRVTKELCKVGGLAGTVSDADSFLVTVKTDIEKEGAKINLYGSHSMQSLKGGIEFDRGIIVMESVSEEIMPRIEASFSKGNIAVEEVECNPV